MDEFNWNTRVHVTIYNYIGNEIRHFRLVHVDVLSVPNYMDIRMTGKVVCNTGLSRKSLVPSELCGGSTIGCIECVTIPIGTSSVHATITTLQYLTSVMPLQCLF